MVEELLFIFDQTLAVIIVRVEVSFRENGEAVVCNEPWTLYVCAHCPTNAILYCVQTILVALVD